MAAVRNDGQQPASKWRYLVALPFAVVGYLSGGMIGVFVAKMVSSFQNCVPADGFPACNFVPYLQVGSLAGLLILPGILVWRLWQSDAVYRTSQRG
ncbi:MAG: hypothetical protein ABI446_14110 [Gemmatimonadaceae bacterium]